MSDAGLIANHIASTIREFTCLPEALTRGFLKNFDGFVKNIVEDETDLAVVAAINEIAHELRIQTIAEYLESTSIVEKLSEIGVDYGQGFALGEPVSLDQADAVVYTPSRTGSLSKDDIPPRIAAAG